jgi:hypothetical protein
MSAPKIPDPNAAAVAGSTADLANFPFKSQIDALSQMGGKQTINGTTYDFTGLGNADVAGKMSDQMAQAMLDIQKNFGPQFVAQRLKDLQQADPTGYAARQQLFDKILADSKSAAPNAQMSADLQNEVNSQLTTSGQLTGGPAGELEEVQQGVRGQQIANGITLGNAAANAETGAVVNAAQNKQNAVQQSASNYLAAGVSPDDIQYRQIQQSLSNLGAFANSQTPEAQFGSLSGAQNDAAPFNPVNYSAGPQINTNAGATGIQQANSIYAGNTNFAASQANPWLAGLSGLTGVANAAAGLGYNPFGSGAPAFGSTYPGAFGNTYMSAPTPGGGGWSVPTN